MYDLRDEARKLIRPWLEKGGNSSEVTRCHLVAAEIERRDRRFKIASDHLDQAEHWVQRSGSVEHLILLLTARMLLAQTSGNATAADACYTEALHLARRCGFGLYHIDLLNHRATALLDRNPKDAAAVVNEARSLAKAALFGLHATTELPPQAPDLPIDDLLAFGALHPRCCYAWGEADARVVLGRCAMQQKDKATAVRELTRAHKLFQRMRAPQEPQVARLLKLAR
jgi:hypothetical protein